MLKPMKNYHIGNTPMVKLPPINGNTVYLKIESANFLGSIKSRTGYALVNGLTVDKDIIIVESTSGNLGLALDYFCKEDGRSFLCLLDETVVKAKYDYLMARGITCEVVPTTTDLDGRESRMKRALELTNSGTHLWVNQYDNEDGVAIHNDTTAPEIFEQTNGIVTTIFCAVGSGGTISGIGEYFKAIDTSVKIIGVEPYGSTIFHVTDAPYITAGAGLRGKSGIIKHHLGVIDDSIAITDSVSIDKCRQLVQEYDLDVGLTTGMAYAAAEQFCQSHFDETVVIIAADGKEFYREYM